MGLISVTSQERVSVISVKSQERVSGSNGTTSPPLVDVAKLVTIEINLS